MTITYPESYQMSYDIDNFTFLTDPVALDGDIEYQFISQAGGLEADGTTLKFPLYVSLKQPFADSLETVNAFCFSHAQVLEILPSLIIAAQQWQVFNPFVEPEYTEE